MKSKIAFIGILLGVVHAWAEPPIVPQAYQDRVSITEQTPISGPDGLRLSCMAVASLGGNLAGTLDGVLYDNNGREYTRYGDAQQLFGIPFVRWTPDTVEFLKKAIDRCAANASPMRRLLGVLSGQPQTGLSMSPQMAKDVVDRIFKIANASNLQKIQIEESRHEQAQLRMAQQRALEDHVARLKSGDDPISNLNDAIYVYDPKRLDYLISSPMLKPDHGFYAGTVILDQQQDSNMLRGRIENFVDLSSTPPRLIRIGYVFLRDKRARIFDPDAMRLERSVRVLGKYIGNMEYETVAGQVKTSPVLDVLFIGR